MKTFSLFSLVRVSLSFACFCSLAASGSAKDDDTLNTFIPLEKCESGSSCVMVFARVGERFRFDLGAEGGDSVSACVRGENASGEKSVLPAGLRFDEKELALVGVPQGAGFHEFVVLRTDRGVTREQVVLIDIQAHTFSGGANDYWSYFSGGVR